MTKSSSTSWRARGTDLGAGLGMPAAGSPVDFQGMTWLTFRNGVIVEGWNSWNLGRLLESLTWGSFVRFQR